MAFFAQPMKFQSPEIRSDLLIYFFSSSKGVITIKQINLILCALLVEPTEWNWFFAIVLSLLLITFNSVFDWIQYEKFLVADYGRIYDHYGFLLFVGHYFEAQIPRFKWPDSKKTRYNNTCFRSHTHRHTKKHPNQIKLNQQKIWPCRKVRINVDKKINKNDKK